MKSLQWIVVLIVGLSLSACVTTVENRLTRKADPDKAVDNYTQLGLGYLKKDNLVRARERLSHALKINSEYAPANNAMALLLITEGEPELAETYFKKAMALEENFSFGHYQYGMYLLQGQRYGEACRHLKVAAYDVEFQQRVSAFQNLGACYYRDNKASDAIKTYQHVLKIQRHNAHILVNLSTLLFDEGQFQQAQSYFDRFLRSVERKQSRHTAHSLWLGIKLAQVKGDLKQVTTLISSLARRFPDSTEYQLYKQSL